MFVSSLWKYFLWTKYLLYFVPELTQNRENWDANCRLLRYRSNCISVWEGLASYEKKILTMWARAHKLHVLNTNGDSLLKNYSTILLFRKTQPLCSSHIKFCFLLSVTLVLNIHLTKINHCQVNNKSETVWRINAHHASPSEASWIQDAYAAVLMNSGKADRQGRQGLLVPAGSIKLDVHCTALHRCIMCPVKCMTLICCYGHITVLVKCLLIMGTIYYW